jgi:hypothetical protein
MFSLYGSSSSESESSESEVEQVVQKAPPAVKRTRAPAKRSVPTPTPAPAPQPIVIKLDRGHKRKHSDTKKVKAVEAPVAVKSERPKNTWYCLRCKEHVKVRAPKPKVDKRGKTRMSGSCPNCKQAVTGPPIKQ